MLTNQKILEKLKLIEKRYDLIRFQKVLDVDMKIWETPKHFRKEPSEKEGARFHEAPVGTRWGGNWMTAWFSGDTVIPEWCHGKKVFVRARTGGDTLMLVDGKYMGVFDVNHPVVMMTSCGVPGDNYHLALEAYAGHNFPGIHPGDVPQVLKTGCREYGGVELLLDREEVSGFVFELKILLQLVENLDENSLRRNQIIRELSRVYQLGALDKSIFSIM